MKTMDSDLKAAKETEAKSYCLEFLTSSHKHPVNSTQTIAGNYIELGRDRDCAVSFDENLTMVSRRHAAIEKRGNEVVLRQLSNTNQTLLNGRPIEREFFLRNGDEIQLSPSGPKIRYLSSVPEKANKGLSNRIQLYARQALKPYKWALISLLVLLLVAGGVATYLILNLRKENSTLKQAYLQIDEQTKIQQDAQRRGDLAFMETQRQTAEKIAESNRQKEKVSHELARLKDVIEELKNTPPPAPVEREEQPKLPPQAALAQMLGNVKSQVYFLKIYLTVEGEIEQNYIGSGTGFMLSDGRFITARHCVNPWAFSDIESKKEQDKKWLIINWLYHNSPKGSVKLNLEVISPDNKKIYLPGDKFIVNESKDFYYDHIDIGYGPGKVQLAPVESDMDWAYYNIGNPSKDGITADLTAAANLKIGTVVHILGYTYGMENQDTAPSPFYSSANVSQNGLTKGLINVTNLGFAQGNSGGPVFIEKDNKLVAIGLVSAGKGTLGMVVPLSAIK